MKLTALSFDTPRRGGAITIGPPPSGGNEPGIWKLRGDVVRSPACFPRSVLPAQSRIKLIIELHSNPAPAQSIWISAEPIGDSSNVLGPIELITIRPERWVGSSAIVRHTFDASKLRRDGVGHERVKWQWYWGYDDGSEVASRLARSEHLLFVTVKPPTEPWSDDAVAVGSETTPWISALLQACEWGRGAKTERQAAERVVQAFFALGVTQRKKNGRFRYYPDGFRYMDPGMANPRWFDLEMFLADVASDGVGDPFEINCIEGASISAAFANLLGCSLDPCVIEGPSCDDVFRLNRIRPLGQKSDKFFREFVFHVVAADRARLANLGNARVFDTTLKIDSDKRPAKRPHKFVLAAGMSLGSKRSKPGKAKYFAQLIDKQSVDGCAARRVGHAMVRRPLQQDSVEVCPLTRFVRFLKELLLAGVPPIVRTPAPMTPTIPGYRDNQIFLRRPGILRVGLPKMPERTQLVYVGPSRQRMIQLDQWTDPDPMVNLLFMAELLASSELPPVRDNGVYSIRGGRTVIAFVQGAVVRLASVGVEELDIRTVQVTWPAALGPSLRTPPRVTRPKAKRARKR